jgi:hypothetical protein
MNDCCNTGVRVHNVAELSPTLAIYNLLPIITHRVHDDPPCTHDQADDPPLRLSK